MSKLLRSISPIKTIKKLIAIYTPTQDAFHGERRRKYRLFRHARIRKHLRQLHDRWWKKKYILQMNLGQPINQIIQ